MVESKAQSVEDYLAALPPEKREVISKVRETVRKSLPEGYHERVSGMIVYEVPLERYPKTYNRQPLMLAAIAAQKNHFAVYLMNVQDTEAEQQLRRDFEKAGKKLDMGKSCIRFKKLEDVPLKAIGDALAATPVDDFIAQYEESRKK